MGPELTWPIEGLDINIVFEEILLLKRVMNLVSSKVVNILLEEYSYYVKCLVLTDKYVHILKIHTFLEESTSMSTKK